MRKILLPSSNASQASPSPGQWLDLDDLATAEISSEDPQHPFENALVEARNAGWRAADPGPQLIRLRFDSLQAIHRFHLVIQDDGPERSQEIALFATTSSGRKEILRQQWNFSPGGSNTEVEDHTFDLHGVSVLELEIDPGRHDKTRFASVQFIGVA